MALMIKSMSLVGRKGSAVDNAEESVVARALAWQLLGAGRGALDERAEEDAQLRPRECGLVRQRRLLDRLRQPLQVLRGRLPQLEPVALHAHLQRPPVRTTSSVFFWCRLHDDVSLLNQKRTQSLRYVIIVISFE